MREEVDLLYIRLCFLDIGKVDKFKFYEEVDVFYNDGWWVGVIFKVFGRLKYKVYFKSTDEEMDFKYDDLRFY